MKLFGTDRAASLPFGLVLVVAILALVPTWLKGKIPAQTDWIHQTAPWATHADETLTDDMGGDSFLVYLPDRLEALRQWRAGRLPLWNAAVGCGQPLLGSQTASPMDPSILLHVLVPLPYALAIGYLLGLLTAGWGMILLLRQQGLRRPGALAVGGIAFALNSYFIIWLELRVFLFGLAALPLALWALEESWDRQRIGRSSGVLALALGVSFLAGTLQTSVLFVAVLGLRLCALLIERWREVVDDGSGAVLRRLVPIVVGVAAGIAIGAPALVSAAEAYAHSIRATPDGAYYAGSNALNWRAFALWFNPGAFGWPGDGKFHLEKALGRTMGGGSGWGSPGFLGVVLAVIALLRGAGPRRVRTLWGGLVGGTLIFLLVQPLGVGSLLKAAWPGIDGVDLLRSLILVTFGVSILAAWGADALLESWQDRSVLWSWLLPLLVVGVVGMVLIGFVRAELATPPHPLFLDCAPLIAAILMLTLVGVAFVPSHRASLLQAMLLVVLVAVPQFDFHFRFNTFSPGDTAYPRLPVFDGLAEAQRGFDRQRLVITGIGRILTPNVATAVGLEEIRSYTNMPPARLRLLLDCAEGQRRRNKTFIGAPESPIYRLLGGGLAFTYWEGDLADSLFRRVPLKGGYLYRRVDALPRAFLVHRVERMDGEAEARIRLSDTSFDPGQMAWMETDAGPLPDFAAPRGPERVEVEAVSPDRMTLRVDAETPGLLVVSNTYFPGWTARIDDRPTPILPANWGVQGIVVTPGTHRVELRYRPAWLGPSLGAALAGVLVAGLLLAAGLKASGRGTMR